MQTYIECAIKNTIESQYGWGINAYGKLFVTGEQVMGTLGINDGTISQLNSWTQIGNSSWTQVSAGSPGVFAALRNDGAGIIEHWGLD